MSETTISTGALYGLMVGMLVSGSCATIVMKMQDETVSECNYFTHPFLQTTCIFLASLLCSGVVSAYQSIGCKAKGYSDELQTKLSSGQQPKRRGSINPFRLVAPSVCDICCTSLMFVSLTIVTPSVY